MEGLIVKGLINRVVTFLTSSEVVAELNKAVYEEANEYLNEKFGGWRNIVREGVRYGIDKAHKLLQDVKESIVSVIKENDRLFRALTQGAVKSSARLLLAEYATKGVAREGTKMILNAGGKSVAKAAASGGAKHVVTQGTKQAVTLGTKKVIMQGSKGMIIQSSKKVITQSSKGMFVQGSKKVITQGSKEIVVQSSKQVITQGSKRVVAQGGKRLASEGTKQVVTQGFKQGIKSAATAATGVGLVADAAQVGLEYYGYEKEGKAVGATGNMASGAIFGAAIGGPPGMAIGAFGGFLVWGTGEVIGKVFSKTF